MESSALTPDSIPPLFAGEWGAPWFAIGCGFTGGGLRELCPKDVLWQFSPFVFTQIHNVMADIPPPNVVAMLDAAYEFGVY